jgi:outer membrane receptor protein involved in Fe transport
MMRAARIFAAAAITIASPAYAQERKVELNLPAGTLDQAVVTLSRQAGVSVGLQDPGLGKRTVRAVRGTMTPARALQKMLKGTALEARQVARGAYMIEPEPRRARPAPAPRREVPEAPPPPPPVRQIVVTASKREVPLSVYPGGVQIIDANELSTAEGARGTQAIESRLASVASTHLGPGRNKLFIRGIADSSFVGPTQATVGQYWGNSRVTYAAPDPNLRLYDVSRIEVLEGPQGTLYGAGALGGVMRVVPHSPDTGRFEGSAWGGLKATQHGQPGADGGLLVNLPLDEQGRLGFRGVLFAATEGGYIDDTGRGLDDVNDVRTFGGRAALRYAPTEDWTIDLNLVGQRIDGDDSQYAERNSGKLSRSSTIAQPYSNEFWLTDLVASRQWGSLEFTGSLGYSAQKVFEQFEGVTLFDKANSAAAPIDLDSYSAYTQTNRIDMLTGEARLARRGRDGTGWLVGVSLLRNSGDVTRTMGTSALTGVSNTIDEGTLYGEYAFRPASDLVLTAGARLAHSELSGSAENPVNASFLLLDPDAGANRSETRLLPSVALSWLAGDHLTLFARYQQSFRPGGIAVRREFIQRFKSDKVGTAEAGLRYRGDDFDLSASGSWTQWRNIQADLIDGFGFPITANIGNGRVYSLGAAANLRPVDGLEFDLSLYLNDSRLTEPDMLIDQLAKAANLPSPASFDRLPNVADVSARAGVSYRARLSADAALTIDAYARYVGQSTLGVGAILGQLQGDYVDTGLEIGLTDGPRLFSLSLTNLFDARGNRFALGSPFLVRDMNQITPLQPRSVRIGVEQNF